jgi:hypothetical protein
MLSESHVVTSRRHILVVGVGEVHQTHEGLLCRGRVVFHLKVTLYTAASNDRIITKLIMGNGEERRGSGLISFIGRVCVVAKSAYELRHAHLSVCLSKLRTEINADCTLRGVF